MYYYLLPFYILVIITVFDINFFHIFTSVLELSTYLVYNIILTSHKNKTYYNVLDFIFYILLINTILMHPQMHIIYIYNTAIVLVYYYR